MYPHIMNHTSFFRKHQTLNLPLSSSKFLKHYLLGFYEQYYSYYDSLKYTISIFFFKLVFTCIDNNTSDRPSDERLGSWYQAQNNVTFNALEAVYRLSIDFARLLHSNEKNYVLYIQKNLLKERIITLCFLIANCSVFGYLVISVIAK